MGENIIRFKTKWELETPENKRSINVLIPTNDPVILQKDLLLQIKSNVKKKALITDVIKSNFPEKHCSSDLIDVHSDNSVNEIS